MNKCDEYVLLDAITIPDTPIGTKQPTNANCTHSPLYIAFLYRAMFSVFDWFCFCWTKPVWLSLVMTEKAENLCERSHWYY